MKVDLAGQVFGKLTVLEEAGRTKAQKVTWKCRCECGVEKIITGGALVAGNTKSCGQHNKEYNVRRGKDKIPFRSNRVPIEDIKAKLPEYLQFDETTYIAASRPARFIDSVYGEYWAPPSRLFNKRNTKGGCYHPQRYKDTLPDRTSVHVGLKLLAKELDIPYSTACVVNRKYGMDGLRVYDKTLSDLEYECQQIYGWAHFDKPTVGKYRPDFKITDDFFIDADGLAWHTETTRDKWYHFNKRKAYEEEGITLWQLYPGELITNSHIVQSMVNHKLQLSSKIHARKCVVKEVPFSESSAFFAENHLMGAIPRKTIGLYFNNELVSAMAYSQVKDIIDIARFCNKVNYAVTGAFTKLLKALPKCKEIVNWVDLRYGNGKHLEGYGFVNQGDILSWRWTDKKQTFNRRQCRANMDDRNLTEAEHAAEKKWVKIYDAGQRKYTLSF